MVIHGFGIYCISKVLYTIVDRFEVLIVYPLVPWIAVMVLGYLMGKVMLQNYALRQTVLIGLGLSITVAFLLLRYSNIYGDPSLWSIQPRGWVFTLLSFLNTSKYPPSLLFLMMTLGPALILLALFERLQGFIINVLLVFGRVPFFFYILHLPVLHISSSCLVSPALW